MDKSDFDQVFVCIARIEPRYAQRKKSMTTMPTEPIAFEVSFLAKLLLIATTPLAVTSLGQTAASPSSQAPVSTSVAAAPPAFEVAAIKLNKSGSGSSDSHTNNGRFTATNESLKNIMQYDAYGIPGSRILDGPKWLDSTKFDIQAKMDDSAADHLRTLPRDQRRLETQAMFQQLLADRFKLAVHWETRELPVYALIVARKGPKLQPAKDSLEGSNISSNGSRAGLEFTTKGITLPQLAEALTQALSRELGHNVIDKTDIKGRYDLTLKWTPDAGTAPIATGGTASLADSGPSIFTAVQEQLGLKLEPAKAPVQVLVIDHAEMPSEN
jgi:uncharacterized protein (TIGR03435 family)